VESLEATENADIGLLVFPELILSRVAFQHFAAQVRAGHEQRHPRGQAVFAMADFHPDVDADLTSAERLVAFIRRSPDPVLQLLRRSVLDEVRRGEEPGTRFVDPALFAGDRLPERPAEPLHERIATANLKTVRELGVSQVNAVLDDIVKDRDRSYARAGLIEPRWSRRVAGR
jgi:hypothetical protein